MTDQQNPNMPYGGVPQQQPPVGMPPQAMPPYPGVSDQGVPPQGAPSQGAPPQGVPYQGVQQPYGAAPGMAAPQPAFGTPNPADKYRGFSIGAVVAIIGSLMALSSYAMIWYVANDDNDATINGFGTAHSTAMYQVTFHSTRLHWTVAAAAIGLLILAVGRLLGNYRDSWVRITVGLSALGFLGAVLAAVMVNSDFKLGTGVYVALAGSLIAGIGGLLMAIAKK